MKNNDIELDEHKGEVPVLITFAYYTKGDVEYDGEDTLAFWVTEEQYEKIQEYNAHPWAYFIGVMINLEMPRINKMVEEEVSEYAYHIFVMQIELDDGDDDEYDDEYDDDYCEQDESDGVNTHYIDEDLPF